MEKVMSFLINSAKKAADFLLCVVKKTAAATAKLLAKGGGKAIQFAGGKVSKFVSDNRQPLLLASMIISAAAMLLSGVFYLLGRRK